MATQVGKDSKVCANCMWWDGEREFKSYGTLAEPRGKCTKRRISTSELQSCTDFEKDQKR